MSISGRHIQSAEGACQLLPRICYQRRAGADHCAARQALSKVRLVEHPVPDDHLQHHGQLKEGKRVGQQRRFKDMQREPLHDKERSCVQG